MNPHEGYRLCQSMLDLCGRHGETCGASLHTIDIDGPISDFCYVVKYICQQVSEDTVYAYDNEEDSNGNEGQVERDSVRGTRLWMTVQVS